MENKVKYTTEEKVIYFKYLLMKTKQEARRLEDIIARLESEAGDKKWNSSMKKIVKKGS